MEESHTPVTEATAARCVPIRELARSAGTLITQVEADGKVFAVSRHGRIVALLVPLPERLILEFEDVPPTELRVRPKKEEEIEVDREALELSPLQEDLVIDAASTPTGYWHPPEIADGMSLALAVSGLELKGLLERALYGTRLTKTGRALARVLSLERGG